MTTRSVAPQGIESDDFLALLSRVRRGRLKVYIGFAAGVGKTWRMLEEAHGLRRRGLDVVLGLIETHGREDTAALIGDMEQVPVRRIGYRGLTVPELDLPALLARRPQIAIIDEVAHANAPGCGNRRRHQDIEQVLDAGISVICAFNVQHLESLRDLVERVAGISVRETVPDSFLKQADQVVNIDLAAEDLLERLRAGKIVSADQIEKAANGFFRPTTLAALRELALREVAESLDRGAPGTAATREGGPARDRLMVCVSSLSPRALALLRRGSRLAGRLNTDWLVAYVETPEEAPHRIDERARLRLAETIAAAREMGATVVRLQGSDPVDTLLGYASEAGVGHIMMGRPARWTWRRPFRTSLLTRMVREASGFDLHVVALHEGGCA